MVGFADNDNHRKTKCMKYDEQDGMIRWTIKNIQGCVHMHRERDRRFLSELDFCTTTGASANHFFTFGLVRFVMPT